MLSEYVSTTERAKWPDRTYEIHYRDITFGENIFSALERIQRKELSDKIFSLIASANPTIFATAINKIQMKRIYGVHAHNPKLLSIRATIHRFSMYLERKGHLGTATIDEEEYKNDKQIRQLVYNMKRYGAEIRSRYYQPYDVNHLERLLDTINISPSEMSTGIQLADVCSRSIWNHFKKSKSSRYKQLEPFFDHNKDVVYEPSLVPARSRWI